jgi:hypothetical protein
VTYNFLSRFAIFLLLVPVDPLEMLMCELRAVPVRLKFTVEVWAE